MLEKLVRKIMSNIGVEDLSNEDCIRIIRTFKLEKLPPHYLFMAISVLPVVEMIIRKLTLEELDWTELVDEENVTQ